MPPNSTACANTSTAPASSFEKIRSSSTAEFAWASDHWTGGGNPIVVVESLGNVDFATNTGSPSLQRAPESNIGGTVSAPGEGIVSTTSGVNRGNRGYVANGGTSAAAPLVSGLAAYLMAYSPGLSPADVKTAIVNQARHDTTDGAAPRIDAFASIMTLPGAQRDLVDVNDYAADKDGNRRAMLGPGTVVTGQDTTFSATPGAFSEPDGNIGMRDFRRFRDAYLATCLYTLSPECAAALSGGTPLDATAFDLNGAPKHVKQDLNFDGCVNTIDYITDPIGPPPHDPQCPTPETVYPRFDFNGDGVLTIADLQMLANQWGTGSVNDTEGWSAGQLQKLLASADLEIHGGAFLPSGASPATVTVRNTATGEVFTRAFAPTDGYIVMTVPITAPQSDFEVTASSVFGGTPIKSNLERVLAVRLGADRRVDLKPALQITYRWQQTVTGGIVPGLISHSPWFDPNPATQPDCTGVGPGTDPDLPTWHCTAINNLDVRGTVLQRNGTLSSPAGAAVTLTEDASGTNSYTVDWGLSPSASPSRYYYATSFCQAITFFNPNPASSSGPLFCHPGSDEVQVRVFGADAATPGVHARYENHPMPTINAVDQTDGVHLQGLRAVGELPYQHSYNFSFITPPFDIMAGCNESASGCGGPGFVRACEPGVSAGCVAGDWLSENNVVSDQPFTGRPRLDTNERLEVYSAIPPDVLLAPRGDGSAIQYAADVTQPIVFPRLSDGSFTPYTYCEVVPKHVDMFGAYHEAYAPGGDMEVVVGPNGEELIGAHVSDRHPFYANGRAPTAANSGGAYLIVKYQFVAVASYGPPSSVPTMPDCTESAPTPTSTATSTATATATTTSTATVTATATETSQATLTDTPTPTLTPTATPTITATPTATPGADLAPDLVVKALSATATTVDQPVQINITVQNIGSQDVSDVDASPANRSPRRSMSCSSTIRRQRRRLATARPRSRIWGSRHCG